MMLYRKLSFFILFALFISSLSPSFASDIEWPESIECNIFSLQRVHSPDDLSLITQEAVRKGFQVNFENHIDEFNNDRLFFWSIIQDNEIKGFIQVDSYKNEDPASQLTKLKEQVSHDTSAQHLHKNSILYEISYELFKKFRGKGLGSQAVKAFITRIPDVPIFGLVKASNVPSRKILEATGFTVKGDYFAVKEEEEDNEKERLLPKHLLLYTREKYVI